MNNYATIHLSDIGRANPVTYVQQNITVPPQWAWGQATRSLICFNSKTKPWSIRVRSDYSIDVDGYGKSKRYRFKDCADAVRIVNACFKAYE
jgi:hypothetical protein